jgi:hypothetical protein
MNTYRNAVTAALHDLRRRGREKAAASGGAAGLESTEGLVAAASARQRLQAALRGEGAATTGSESA